MNFARRVLIVDDSAASANTLALLAGLLGYEAETCARGQAALTRLSGEVDLVVVDPHGDSRGFEAITLLRSDATYGSVAILVVIDPTAAGEATRAAHAGATDVIARPVNIAELELRAEALARLNELSRREVGERASDQASGLCLAIDVAIGAHDVAQSAHVDAIRRLALAAEQREGDAAGHIDRIGGLGALLAERIGLSEEDALLLRHSLPLHDVGKCGLPDEVLAAEGRLTAPMWERLKSHTLLGARLLAGSASPLLQAGETIARSHHERWDGEGYPHGLSGERIPLFARICAVVDAFEELTRNRPFRETLPAFVALDIMRSAAGTHFDPELVTTFANSADEVVSVNSRVRRQSLSHRIAA